VSPGRRDDWSLGLELLGPVEKLSDVGSTNDEALRRAELGAPEGLVLWTDTQTAGRGRHGRAWVDVPGVSLAYSILLRPTIPLRQYPLLALAMACSVAEAGEELTGAALTVKWPNDVLHRGRKLCGILAESRVGPGAARAASEAAAGVLVIGTGVNVNHREDDFLPELRTRATSLRLAGGGREIEPEQALTMVLPRFERYLAMTRDGEAAALWSAVRPRLPMEGTPARVRSGDRVFEGVVEGFTETGALLLREDPNERAIVLVAGEWV
jgi:BirA family transcriptional regulator, biotin operon repressor / biotin---[acetyl-CoA-carboxylase] ligase